MHVAGAAAAHGQAVDNLLNRDVVLDRRQLKHTVNVVDSDDVRLDPGMVFLKLLYSIVSLVQVRPGPKLVDVKLKIFRQL